MDPTRSNLRRLEGAASLEVVRPVLVVVEGPELGRRIVLTDTAVVLGRGAEAGIRLEDPGVSRSHLRLVPDGDGFRVEDLGSKQGTFVDRVRVERGLLRPGGVLGLGTTLLRLGTTTLTLTAEGPAPARLGGMVATSPAMRELFGLMAKVGPLDFPVLVLGETGTGKEGLARALHDAGPRAAGPFVVVDCTLLAGEHLRSELFGHVRGAFTGAAAARQGAFERAHRGTLFLDEVGELPLELQPTLLRALQEGEVRPLGSDAARRADVRVVSATHRDPAAMVRAGSLREDLFYRLSAIRLELPPLRARPQDIPLLAGHFLPPGVRLSPAALARLAAHPWPGNVRELEQTVRVAAALARDGVVEAADLQLRPVPAAEAPDPGPGQSRAEAEEAELRRALKECKHHRGAAAKLLGIARSTLYERMKKYGIE